MHLRKADSLKRKQASPIHQLLRSIPFALLLVLLASSVQAQPVLRITEMFPNWPFITLKYTYRCDGNWTFNVPQSNIQVFENGREVKDFSLWCPQPGDLCPLAAALVMDGSESMAGFKNEQAKKAAKHFVGLMDGDHDEVALFWFNKTVTLRVPMTKASSLLIPAIDELPASNLTAAWDAAYAAINHVVNYTNVPSQCRAVILLTDGKDNSSSHTLEQVIAYALSERVRVFVVALGEDINEPGLYQLATRTNGKYFTSIDAIDLSDIFERVFMEARSLQECQLFYRAECPDGTERHVELRISDYCGGTVSETRIYNAPLDSSMFAIGYFEAGAVTTKEETTAELPIHVLSLPWTGLFPAGTMTLKYDTTCISFVDVYESGTLLDGANIRSQRVPEGVKLEWDAIEVGQNFGTLMLTYFRTFTTDSASCCEVEIADFHFYHGCLKPLSGNGTICYYSKPPDVQCSLSAPDSLSWSYQEDGYVPNPFRVTYILRNVGDKPAKNVRYNISYNPKQITLLQPTGSTQTGKSEDLAPWASDTVSWLVKVNPQGKSGTVQVCVTAHFDNRGDLECCTSTRVEQAPSTMVCSIDAPRIVAQTALERYSPMPFNVLLNVFNSGVKDKDSVTAEIFLKDSLKLFGNESALKFVTAKLLPDSTASTSWTLWHRPVQDSVIIPVRVRVISSSGDTTHCETLIVIPPLEAPILELLCDVPGYLDLDPFSLEYSPNPFVATLTIKNTGTRAAENLEAYLMLPDGVELEGQESQRKQVLPSTLQPGDETTVEWALRYTDKLIQNQRMFCRWSVFATTEGNAPLDSVKTECDIAVPGVPPSLLCEINALDTLFVEPNIGLLYPNPIPVNVQIRNGTVLARGLSTVRARLYSADAEFEASTPAIRVLNTMMNPGRSVELQWYVRVKPSRKEQKVIIVVTVVDEKGIETTCTHTIIVPPSPLYISCEIDASTRVFIYQRSSGTYFPDSVMVNARLWNESDGDLVDTPIRLEMDGADSFLQPDPSIPGNTLERTIAFWAKDSTKDLSWVLKPQAGTVSDNPEVIVFAISYFDPQRGWLRTGCTIDVVIEPQKQLETQLSCEVMVPDTIRFVDSTYVPDIFLADVRVTNEGETPATNVQIYLLLDARFSGIGPAIRAVPTIPIGATHVVTPEFELRARPSHFEGWDTLRVLVLADEGLSTTCEVPVFIERQTSPEMFVECVADIDTIRFDEATNSYDPDIISLSTLVANSGDGPARSVAATALIPSGYQILDSATVALGTLNPGAAHNLIWRIKPTCEATGSEDSIRIIVRGVGGLGNQIHIDECAMVLFKEACAEPEVTLSCSLPDTVHITSTAGDYAPVPVIFSTRIENTSTFKQSGLSVRFNAVNVFTLAPGESIVKPVPELLPGGSEMISWEIIPSNISTVTDARTCAELLFGDDAIELCCADCVVLPYTPTVLDVACSAPDSLELNETLRGYAGVPISFCVDATNSGTQNLTDVQFTVTHGAGLEPVEPLTRTLQGPFTPGAALPQQCWTIDVLPTYSGRTGWITITVSAAGDEVVCTRYIKIPAVRRGAATCELALPDGDTLTSVRQGVQFPVQLVVEKADSIAWNEVSAEIELQDFLVLAGGETTVKNAADGVLSGNTSTLTWMVDLPALYRDAAARIRVVLTRNTQELSQCEITAFVRGIMPTVSLHVPPDVFASFGKRFAIPVIIDTIDPVVITETRTSLSFDPTLIHVTGYSTNGALTEVGWNVLSFTPDNVNGTVSVVVGASGFGGQLQNNSPLLYLIGSTVGDERRSALEFFQSPMDFILEDDSGMMQATSMKASVDGITREMRMLAGDGRVYVTGDCILPVNAIGGTFALENSPNPFNPQTRITFRVPEAMDIKVSVYDAFGREVAVVFAGWTAEGTSSVVFDASSLPAGVYFSILETPLGIITDKMNLVK